MPFLSHPAALSEFIENGHRAASTTDSEERAAILAAYAEAGGNKTRMAELLGVSRKTLYARIRRLGLEL